MSDSVDESIRLLQRYRNEDSRAAELLFHRYVARLTALVRARLSPKLARRIDPEDVVQSAYRTFFLRARDGAFELQRGGDLWRLLAAITVNKLSKQIERNLAAKRDVSAEQSTSSGSNETGLGAAAIDAHVADPYEEAALKEEVEVLTAGLDETQHRMLEMRLAGYSLEEIATECSRSERTVRRLLEKIKDRLEVRLEVLHAVP